MLTTMRCKTFPCQHAEAMCLLLLITCTLHDHLISILVALIRKSNNCYTYVRMCVHLHLHTHPPTYTCIHNCTNPQTSTDRHTIYISTHMCTSSHSTAGCTSVTFPTHGVPYTKVCGRAIAYQRGTGEAFYNYHHESQQSLNDYYVDGLSVTHGDPRNHIWTFAAGISKGMNYPDYNCPCDLYPGPAAPPFVGEEYFVSLE